MFDYRNLLEAQIEILPSRTPMFVHHRNKQRRLSFDINLVDMFNVVQ